MLSIFIYLFFMFLLAPTTQTATSVGSLKTTELIHSTHDYTQSTLSSTNQVQVATQTQSFINNKPTVMPLEKKSIIASSTNIKGKKTKYLLTQQQASSHPETSVSSHQPSSNFLKQNFHVDPKAGKNRCFLHYSYIYYVHRVRNFHVESDHLTKIFYL